MGFYLTKAKRDRIATALSEQLDFDRIYMDHNGIAQYLSLDYMIDLAEEESNQLEQRIVTSLMCAFQIHNSRH